MRPRALGAATAAAVVVVDQVAKFWVTRALPVEAAPTPLGPFLDLALRWNRGISFSLIPQNSALGVTALVAFALGAAVVLGCWLWRTRALMTALGVGAILGGALGNACDRFAYGAVIDFLDLHAFGRHFFVFNVADAAISVGVLMLLIEAFAGRGGAK